MRDSDEWDIAGVILAGLSLIVSIAAFAQPEIRRCIGLDQGDCSFGNSRSLPKTVSSPSAPTKLQETSEAKLHVRFPGTWAGFLPIPNGVQVFLDETQVGSVSCNKKFNLDITTNIGKHQLMFRATAPLNKQTKIYDIEVPVSGQYEVLLTPDYWGWGCFNDNFTLTQQ
jgi:hypothetical protein